MSREGNERARGDCPTFRGPRSGLPPIVCFPLAEAGRIGGELRRGARGSPDAKTALGLHPTSLAIHANVEEEIAALDPNDRAAFLKDFGIEEPASRRLIRASYAALGLRSFFTSGPDEVRAWTIRAGDDAVAAAGRIHSDLARGFIRAEVTAFDALRSAASWREAKAKNATRLEGKEYAVADGDILNIRFAV